MFIGSVPTHKTSTFEALFSYNAVKTYNQFRMHFDSFFCCYKQTVSKVVATEDMR